MAPALKITSELFLGIPIRDLALFLGLIISAVAMGAALAHALELPNKIAMPRDDYFVTQQAYRGWSQLAWILIAQLASLIWIANIYRHQPTVLWPVLIAIGCLVGAQALFWAFTFPANRATRNWTWIPDDWEKVRQQWEYSHAGGAAFQMVGLAALIVAALSRGHISISG